MKLKSIKIPSETHQQLRLRAIMRKATLQDTVVDVLRRGMKDKAKPQLPAGRA